MGLTELRREPIPANYFNQRSYIKSNPATGLLATRQGKRLIAIPDLLIQSIHQTLLAEAGDAASMAFYTFGYSWGKSFYERVRKETEVYYEQAIGQLPAAEYFAIVRQLWAVHGLGKITVDFQAAKHGVLLVIIQNSGISTSLEEGAPLHSKSFSTEAGLIAGWFSANTRQDLGACATGWQRDRIEYLVAATAHLEKLETNLVSKGLRTREILARL
ncbi:MAG: hypothetical protein SFT94_10375 [Pseudanabaenaceae cyanobacterium bins.68]|nr:hypothetical protein [Pseudanabaenaceae cyanobacterium bins.68]